MLLSCVTQLPELSNLWGGEGVKSLQEGILEVSSLEDSSVKANHLVHSKCKKICSSEV